MSTEGGTKAVIAALLANSGIAVSKFVAFVITGSTSMLSEAIHSVADALNQVLLLIGGKRSKRVADEKYQFGYGRVRYVYGFMVAIVLFMVGGIYSLYEGWHKWNHPEPVDNHWIAIGVLTIAILLESLSFRTAILETNKVRGKRSFAKFVRDARQPELPVILLEDFGALLGLVFAMFGVSFAVITGDGRWDGMGAMAIGTLLIIIAIILIREMSAMLVGEGALPEEYDAVKAALESAPLVERVIHLRTLHVGPDALLVGAKIAITRCDTAQEIAEGIDEAERLLRLAVPSAQYVFLEPDLDRRI
ncbi:MAG: cation diffusion facilitator family transporter [Candidatus Nanopelagicales bacterium]|nr:cation diffusion facilitator family transporter [Candidatus Nanopelagicales bacterium]